MDCVFIESEQGYKCSNCGVVKKRITRRNCGLHKGVGDRVAGFTKAIGIKPCGGCNKRRSKLNEWAPTPAYANARLIPTTELIADSLRLAEMIPSDIDGIVGVPRSGMIPASVIATHLHLPLYTFHKGQAVTVGRGSRLRGPEGDRLAFIDDTTMMGSTLKRLESVIGLKASVYVNPHSPRKPDLFVKDLEPPHLLEWNLFNSGYVRNMAFDMDGVICHDEPPRNWLKVKERPRYLPRNESITIITARFEKHRQHTENWLKAYGVGVEKLIMFGGTEAERNKPQAISRYKAEALKESGKEWFVESCRIQSKEIAEFTGAWVICTEDFKVY